MIVSLKNIIYINLDRKPDRNQNILNYFGNDPRLLRVSGIDGQFDRDYIVKNRHLFINRDIQLAIEHEIDENPAKIEPDYHCYNTYIHFNLMGNTLSHIKVWRQIVETLEKPNDCALVLNDDAIVSPEFFKDIDGILSDFPSDAKVVWLSRHECAIGGHFVRINFNEEPDIDKLFYAKATDTIGYLKMEVNPCAVAYLVTKTGAQFLLDHTPYVTAATDCHMNELLSRHNIHYATYKAYMTTDTKYFRSCVWE